MSTVARLRILALALVVVVAFAAAYTLHAATRTDARDRPVPGGPAVVRGTVALARGSQLLFRNMAWGPERDRLASVPLKGAGGQRTASPLTCYKFHASGGMGVCVQAKRGPVNTFSVLIVDSVLRELRRYPAGGGPTRTRVSPSGRMAAWTVFVRGDSYAGLNFSTRTAILDTRTGVMHDNLEKYAVFKNGKRYRSADINFWGVTFADDERFYATMATKGRTYLVEGNVPARAMRTIKENAECPSVSPDGTRVAFKHRIPGDKSSLPWRLHVLDLRTMKETPVAEQRALDDQVSWLDDKTLLYAIPAEYEADQWKVPADGSGRPELVMKAATSPAVIH